MAWAHIATTVEASTIKPGWFESKSSFANAATGEARSLILQWDHSPTAADKTTARDLLLDRLVNPEPSPTPFRDAKIAIKTILASGQTAAQKLTAIDGYLDAQRVD